MDGTLIFLGNICAERLPVDILAAEFGWAIRNVTDLDDLWEIGTQRRIIAVLFDAQTLHLVPDCALKAIQDAAPNALPIVCYRSSEPIRWSELAEAGAFHALLLPLHSDEVRQSLAFVREAQVRRRSKVISLPLVEARHNRGSATAVA
jgi:hypothetical protein